VESKLRESDWAKIRYKQLNLISKKRLVAIDHTSCINKEWLKHMTRRSDLGVFREGDIVLRKIFLYSIKIKVNEHPTTKAHI
jgi:hypothetical protein